MKIIGSIVGKTSGNVDEDIQAKTLMLTEQTPTHMCTLTSRASTDRIVYDPLLKCKLTVPPSGRFMVMFNGVVNFTEPYTDAFFRISLDTGEIVDPASGGWNSTEADISMPVSGTVLMTASPGIAVGLGLEWRVGQLGKAIQIRPGTGAEHLRLWALPLP